MTTRKHSKIVPVWNYRQLILSLGSSTEIVRRIKREGYDPPSPQTINSWRYKGRVPSQWTPLFLKWAFKSGALKSIDQLLVRDQVTL
jgi:hypothetical protein